MEPAEPSSGWTIVEDGADAAGEPWRETVFALADGVLGVRGGLEERASPSGGAYLAGVYETTPIHYHERHPGFAASTDTRLPLPDGARIQVEIDGERLATDLSDLVSMRRALDLRGGRIRRIARWRTRSGGQVELVAERVMAAGAGGVIALRLALRSIDVRGRLILRSVIDRTARNRPQGDDNRIGADLEGGGLQLVGVRRDGAAPMLIEQTRRSGIWVAAAQAHRCDAGLARGAATLEAEGLVELFEAQIVPGAEVRLEKFIACQSWPQTPAEADLDALATRAAGAAAAGFDGLAAQRRAELDGVWDVADVQVEGDPDAERALRFNLFHVFQSASRDPDAGTAAKGLTGEGYEGHLFWDTEAFVLPALVFLAPALARQALVFRWSRLEGARETARALNHRRGALFPWRTIAGRECSAHYPSGSAQYHINGAIALAIELYWTATGDDAFLLDHGAEVLFETARLWMELGRYSLGRGGRFCVFGVTGPDEYTALVDNNHYTNKIAARHLAFAAATAARLAETAPDGFGLLADGLQLGQDEIEAWRRAAAAIYLPEDAELGIDAQDEAFLGKPAWPFDLTDEEHRPLLLECHPMTLYRHQICKQADLIQAMAFLGDDVPEGRMRANLDYYEAVTTHDSTLSHGPFAIVAARVGLADKALGYFRRNLAVDLEDRHHNAGHGSHMAALASSWLALTMGFAGLSWRNGELGFKPVLPEAWRSVRFAILWRGHRLAIGIGREATTYGWAGPEPLAIRHFGDVHRIEPGRPVACPNPTARQAAA